MRSGIVRSLCFCGLSLASRTNRPSLSNGCMPFWNCGIVMVPRSSQNPSCIEPLNSARFSITGSCALRTASERLRARSTSSPVVNTVATSTSLWGIASVSSESTSSGCSLK